MRNLAAEFPNDNPALHAGACWVCMDVTGTPVAILPEPAALPEPPSLVEALIEAPVPSMSVMEILVEAIAEPISEPLEEPILDTIPDARISGIVGLGETARDHDHDDAEPIVVEELPPLDDSALLEGPALDLDLTVLTVDTVQLEIGGDPRCEPSQARAHAIAPPAPDDPWVTFVATLADVAIGAGSPHVASALPGLLVEGVLPSLPDDVMKALAEARVVRGVEVDPAFVAKTRAWIGILRGTSDDFDACGNAMLDEWGADLLARLLGSPSRADALKRELRSRGIAAFGLAA